MKAFILAGGKGTRLLPLTKSLPKPMVNICGKPLLQYQIELLRNNGFTEATLIINHLGEIIRNYFQDGIKFGVKIDYIFESKPMGTAGTIKIISESLKDDFLVIYGDLLANIDLRTLVEFHHKHKGIGSLVVHPNNHPEDSDLLELGHDDRIVSFYLKPHNPDFIYHNLVNAAIYILSPEIVKYIPKDVPSDFAKDIFPTLLHTNQKIYGYRTYEYIKDIGTRKRLEEAKIDINQGYFKEGNRSSKRKAIFMDRDGVINHEMDHVVKLEDIILIDKVPEAIKKINNSKFLPIVVSNQPQAAMGLCDIDQIDKINKKVETLLGDRGAYLSGIYTCLHHPDKGFPGENPVYKVLCDCRKPKTGMVDKALHDFNIDIRKSYMVGDTTTDALTAKNSGLKFIGVRTGYGCADHKYDVKIDTLVDNLEQAVDLIMQKPRRFNYE